MSDFLTLLFFIATSVSPGRASNLPKHDVSYEELDSSDLTCNNLDNCRRNRTDDLTLYNCHCGQNCSVLGTCCVDSKFRNVSTTSTGTVKCLSIHGLHVFMVDSCIGDTVSRDLCLSDPEETNDPFLLIPVTSSRTGISYKNIFCAACNEDIEVAPPRFWILKLSGNSDLIANLSEPILEYDSSIRSWTARDEGVGGSTVVSVGMIVPNGLAHLVKKCRPGVVSRCSEDWSDAAVAEKCLSSYMAVVLYHRNETTVRYKNPHCAICNFEDPSGFDCSELTIRRFKPGSVANSMFVGLFSFEEKTKRCRDKMVYDKLSGKCRVVKCGKRQIFVDGNCI